MGATRIGHGIRAGEDTACIAQLRTAQVPLELCFTSNCQTKAIKDPSSYPLKFFLEQGIRLTVNTDNMTVSGTTLRQEYLRLHWELGIPTDTLQTIACNAADAAFVTPQEAERLKVKICEHFSKWLETGTIA
jgi:adenosine deaminase